MIRHLPPPAAVEGRSDAHLPLPDPEAYEGEPREYARALMNRKADIDAEIDRLHGILAEHSANASTPLLDPEGYPRGDIDIYAIRHTRSAIARLITDRSEVERLLPAALEAAFSAPYPEPEVQRGARSENLPNGHHHPESPEQVREQDNGWRTRARGAGVEMLSQWPESPVARVNSVAPSSPAAASGLQAGDIIYSFAGVTSEQGMHAIGTLVQASANTALRLLVLRGDERITLILTPRSDWGGRGSLGCHIVPP